MTMTRHEMPQGLDEWNRHRGERISVLTTAGIVLTGRLESLTQTHDGALHMLTMDVEQVAQPGADPVGVPRASYLPQIFGPATIPGTAIMLITFAE